MRIKSRIGAVVVILAAAIWLVFFQLAESPFSAEQIAIGFPVFALLVVLGNELRRGTVIDPIARTIDVAASRNRSRQTVSFDDVRDISITTGFGSRVWLDSSDGLLVVADYVFERHAREVVARMRAAIGLRG